MNAMLAMERITAIEGENRGRMAVAFGLLTVLPWMFVLARTGVEVCTAGIGLLFLWRSAAMRDWQWLRTPFIRVAFVAWLWLVLISPFALVPEKSLPEALSWGRFILLFAALRYWLLTTRQAFLVVAASLALLLSFSWVDTMWQYITQTSLTGHPIWDAGRLTGPFEKPKVGIFTARLLLPFAAIGAVIAVTRPWKTSAWVFGGVLACVALILLSGERTAFIMSMGALAAAAVLIALREKKLRVISLTLMSMLVVVMLALFYTQSTVQHTLERTVKNVGDFSASPYGQVFGAALKAGQENWLTGVGMRGLRQVMPRSSENMVDGVLVEERFVHAHNPYLEWFAEAGVPGLLLFLLMIACLAWEALLLLWRTRGVDTIIPAFMAGALLLHFFPFVSTQSYFSNWVGVMVWYSLAVVFSLRNILPQMTAKA